MHHFKITHQTTSFFKLHLFIPNSRLSSLCLFLSSSCSFSFLIPPLHFILFDSSVISFLFLSLLRCLHSQCTSNHSLRNSIRFLWSQTCSLAPCIGLAVYGISKGGYKCLPCERRRCRDWGRRGCQGVVRGLLEGERSVRILSRLQLFIIPRFGNRLFLLKRCSCFRRSRVQRELIE
jgi:hypothetical protein